MLWIFLQVTGLYVSLRFSILIDTVFHYNFYKALYFIFCPLSLKCCLIEVLYFFIPTWIMVSNINSSQLFCFHSPWASILHKLDNFCMYSISTTTSLIYSLSLSIAIFNYFPLKPILNCHSNLFFLGHFIILTLFLIWFCFSPFILSIHSVNCHFIFFSVLSPFPFYIFEFMIQYVCACV